MEKMPPQEAIRKALTVPNGFVYEVDEHFKDKVEVPPQGIRGAWKVDDKGIIVGKFIDNPNFIPDFNK